MEKEGVFVAASAQGINKNRTLFRRHPESNTPGNLYQPLSLIGNSPLAVKTQ
jgi:hypothetical protein